MLTYIQINAAKPRAKSWTLSDSQGLHLQIQPNGSKLWRFKYRFLDKQKTLHLGGWPQVAVPILFALLDAYYLAQEKRFRDLYEAVSAAPIAIAGEMSLKPRALNSVLVLKSILSLSVGGFYLALLTGMSILLYIAAH